MTARPRVLVIGLDPFRVPGPWDPEPVATSLCAARDRFAAADVDAVECYVGLDGSDDVEQVVANAVSGGPWACVLVGAGLRHGADVTVFEQVLNVVHRGAPEAAIALNETLDDVVDAVLPHL